MNEVYGTKFIYIDIQICMNIFP